MKAIKKYKKLRDEFVLQHGCKIKRNESYGTAFALDINTIKQNVRGPREFFGVCRLYLKKRPNIIKRFDGKSASVLAHRFTLITIIEQEFRNVVQRHNIDPEFLDLSVDDAKDGLSVGLGINRSKISAEKAELFSKDFGLSISDYLKRASDGGVEVLDENMEKIEPNTDHNDISEFIEGVHIDDIKGEA